MNEIRDDAGGKPMVERIYNIFLVFENDNCSSIRYLVHDHSGSDEEGINFLKARVSVDLPESIELELKNPFTRSEYNAKCRLGCGHHLYDELFVKVCAGENPLFVTTPVKNGEVFFNYSAENGHLDVNEVAEKLGDAGKMDDWLVKYTDESGIKLSELIHDDYFLAIKLTFNARLYVSAMKLLVSCIDSLAYIEYGNSRNIEPVPFVKWLDSYAELTPLGITADELWELRNGLLHMTNLQSTKVQKNKVRRISFRVGGRPNDVHSTSGEIYYFDFYGLIQAFAKAQGRWVASYNSDRDKFAKFVERYDETISDSRIAIIKL